MIGDAAVAAADEMNKNLSEKEERLSSSLNASGIKQVQFNTKDVDAIARNWISAQPEAFRTDYREIYEFIKAGGLKHPERSDAPKKRTQLNHVFFATTREDNGGRKLRYRFGDARTNIIKCGRIDEDTRRPQGQEKFLVGKVISDNPGCLRYLGDAIRSTNRTLVFVHGFNNRFSDALDRALMLKSKLGADVSVVMWSWPAKRDALGSNYRYDKESAGGIAQVRFRNILAGLLSNTGHPISILAHSMGGWHTLGAIESMADRQNHSKLQNLVMAAPDVPADEFRFALASMNETSSRVTLYACAWDWALLISKQWNQFARAGTGGERNILVANKLDSIDVDGRLISTNHAYVFDSTRVQDDLAVLLVNDEDAAARGLKAKQKESFQYWIYP